MSSIIGLFFKKIINILNRDINQHKKDDVFYYSKGFTLIELLVVVAIIGIISSIVFVSVNTIREKGNITFAKRSLASLYKQASITYTETGSYSSVRDSSGNCIGSLSKIASEITNKGFIVKCYSYYSTTYGDIYNRFGATVLLYDSSKLKAWSVDENGVVKWDEEGVNLTGSFVVPDISLSWTNANLACSRRGGKSPSLEQLKSLVDAWYKATYDATGTGSYTPYGFNSGTSYYWSSSVTPSSTSYGYRVLMSTGAISRLSKSTTSPFVHCVGN